MVDRSYRTFVQRVMGGMFLVWCAASAASAQTLTFEDLPLGAQYHHGDSFISDSVQVMFGTYFYRDGTPTQSGAAFIQNGQNAGGSGNELWISNVNASFAFQGLTALSLLFGEYGGNLNISINGDFRNFEDFADINGLTIGGSTVVVTAFDANRGNLSISGTINSFALGGQELAIDNLAGTLGPCSTLTVDSLGDSIDPNDGFLTLREALDIANSQGNCTIVFDPSLSGGTIQPLSQLPDIVGGNITIDGDIGGDCIPDIVLDGSLAGGAHGLVLGSPSNRIRGLIVSRFLWTGITVHGSPATGNVIECCYVGTDLTGTADQGNTREGIFIKDGASSNTVGSGNVVSGNGLSGVLLEGNATSGNVIRGNRIGTDRGATFAIANGEQGVVLRFAAHHNTVGPGNVISGNGGGVLVALAGTDENVILGNLVGTNHDGTSAVANAGYGVMVFAGPQFNRIGGSAPEDANIISGNSLFGVIIRGGETSGNLVVANVIGTDASGTFAIPNTGAGVSLDSAASANTIGPGNLISANSGPGVLIDNGHDNHIRGNKIGTDATGTTALGNVGTGLNIRAGSRGNTIGGSDPNDGNVISGNGAFGGAGLFLNGAGTSDNRVLGNLVGTSLTGAVAIPNNGMGIVIAVSASGNVIGPGNVVSGNTSGGILIDAANSNIVYGNVIGTNAAHDVGLGNREQGIILRLGASNNTIGPDNFVSGNGIGGLLITLAAADNEIFQNVFSANSVWGISVSRAATSHNVLRDNFVGVDASGLIALPNFGPGVVINEDARDNTFGPNNVVSGNLAEGLVIIDAHDNTIHGNMIGTDQAGITAVGNGAHGVVIAEGGTGNIIGPGNVISANGTHGIQIRTSATATNHVFGNMIGSDVTGSVALPNSFWGVAIEDGANNNIIGPSNVVMGNIHDGIRIDGPGTAQNTLTENSITSNGAQGINLSGAANMGIESPQLLAKVGDSLFGTSDAPDGSVIEVFSDPEDEGQWIIGIASVLSGTFTLTTPTLNQADNITATVTDILGNTSEFSVPLACFGSPGDPDSDGDGVPDHCEISEDCNGNGIPDADEIGDSGDGTIFATGIGTPEDIVPSDGTYPPGFLVTDLATLSVVHVSPLGGTLTPLASGFQWPIGATMAPDEFGGLGSRLFVADQGREEVLWVAADGSLELFASLPNGGANGITYIPGAVGGTAGGVLLVTAYHSDTRLGSVQTIDASGMVTTLHTSISTGVWTPALAPAVFGEYGNHVFFGALTGSQVYAYNIATNALSVFAIAPLPPTNHQCIRQLSFSPVGWAASLDATLANESVLLVSVASASTNSFPGEGFISVWDQRGKMVAALYKGADALVFEPRGMLFVKNDLLISDIADDHGWMVRTTIGDFGSPDCDHDGVLDECEIAAGSSDCNLNAVPDECEVDCNGNGVADQCELIDGTASDCDGNFIPDSCEAFSDCNGNGIPDTCDLENGTTFDCNQNGLSDDCELAFGFSTELSENTTGFPDWFFIGVPDGPSRGLAGQAVTFDFGDRALVIALPGSDFSVYEAGGPEYESIDVLVSVDGVDFVSVKLSEAPLVRIPGDEAYTNDASGRSYDLSVVGLDAVRFIRIDGVGDGIPVENFEGFDLDAIGAIHLEGDCDENGMPDVCQDNDFDGDGEIDSCDLDIDNDGVDNDLDVCDFTVPGTPIGPSGQPIGDWDLDCDVELDDYVLFEICFSLSGPDQIPPFAECLDAFDADLDADVDLNDVRVFQLTFGSGQ